VADYVFFPPKNIKSITFKNSGTLPVPVIVKKKYLFFLFWLNVFFFQKFALHLSQFGTRQQCSPVFHFLLKFKKKLIEPRKVRI
jgi:hypothetical protein